MPIVTGHFIERFFGKKRVIDNCTSALEHETQRYIDHLSRKYNNDEEKMLKRIIPVLKVGEVAKVILRNKEVEKDVTVENIDNWSNMNNPCFWIFNQINFKFFSEEENQNTFLTTDWTSYKKEKA